MASGGWVDGWWPGGCVMVMMMLMKDAIPWWMCCESVMPRELMLEGRLDLCFGIIIMQDVLCCDLIH